MCNGQRESVYNCVVTPAAATGTYEGQLMSRGTRASVIQLTR